MQPAFWWKTIRMATQESNGKTGSGTAIKFKGAFMQSFTSVGPMLDIAALFSAIAVYAGLYLGFVMILAFLITSGIMYVVYSLASRFRSNGGYYFFAASSFGKGVGVVVSIMYVAYAVLVVPDISLFVSYFITYLLPLGPSQIQVMIYIVPIIFLMVVCGIVSLGLGRSIKYTVLAGAVEFLFIVAIDILFLYRAHGILVPTFSGSTPFLSIFSGVVFGVLAFAGNGSSIFLSEDTENSRETIPRGIKYSYIATGLLMIISAFSMVSFLGQTGIAAYTSDPIYITTAIRSDLSYAVYVAFALIAVLSATNLSVSYTNALLNNLRKMVVHEIIPFSWFGRTYMLLTVVFLGGCIVVASTYYLGPVNAFIVIAAVVSIAYMVLHLIAAFSLMKISGKNLTSKGFIAALGSAILLAVTILFSLISDATPGSPLMISIASVGLIVAASILITAAGKKAWRKWYSEINITGS
jgi:amino acid transporter